MNSEKGRPARLIVLLPESLTENLEFAQKIHWMAARAQNDVLYLALLDNPDNSLTAQRGIATMKAATESNLIRVGSVLAPTARWFEKLQEVLRPGDTLVCHAEQEVKQGFLKTVAMPEYLAGILTAPVVTVEGFYFPQRVMIKGWISGLLFWLGALVILAGFTFLELQADTAFPGFAHKLVLGAVLLVEFGAFWLWSQIVRR
ncbi:MAG: hypothetical protein ACYC3P_05535 [Bellilinea sp.]